MTMKKVANGEKVIRFGELDFLKFIFSILIVYYHLTPILSGIFPEEGLYATLTKYNTRVGSNVVIAFFIMSGFFFEQSLKKETEEMWKYITKKVIRLWPVLAFSLFINFSGVADVLNLFFLNAGLGVMKEGSSNPASWYVCSLFWISIMFYGFFKGYEQKEKKTSILLALVVIMYALITHRPTTGLPYSELVSDQIPFLTNGNAMGILGFSIGMLFAQHKYLYKIKSKYIVFVCQIVTSCYCIYIYSFCDKIYPRIFYTIVFIVALYFLVCQEGLQTFKESNVFRKLGAYSYAIYLMQFPCFHYLKKAIAQGKLLWASPKVMVIVGLVFCIVTGIVTYYIIERPMGKLLQRKVTKLTSQ